MSSPERGISSESALSELYYGTTRELALGMSLDAELSTDSELDTRLDAVRPSGAPSRAASIPVAASIKEATVIADIRSGRRHDREDTWCVRVYRVQAAPFQGCPLAVLEELRRRSRAGGLLDALIREYWQPTGLWHIRELLAAAVRVIAEVPPASDRETYIPRWVLYRQDRERADAL